MAGKRPVDGARQANPILTAPTMDVAKETIQPVVDVADSLNKNV